MQRRLSGPAHLISVAHRKGGDGKTMVISNLGVGLAASGYAVAICEVDDNPRLYEILVRLPKRGTRPIDDSRTTLALFDESLNAGVRSAMWKVEIAAHLDAVPYLSKDKVEEECSARGWVQPQALHILPGSQKLEDIDALYAQRALTTRGFQPITKLQVAIEELLPYYDFILFDTPPSLTTIQRNVLKASHFVIGLATFDPPSIRDLDRTVERIKQVARLSRDMGQSGPRVLGVVLNRYNAQNPDVDGYLLHCYTEPHADPDEPSQIEPALIEYPILACLPLDDVRAKRAMSAKQTVITHALRTEIGQEAWRMVQAVEAGVLQLVPEGVAHT